MDEAFRVTPAVWGGEVTKTGRYRFPTLADAVYWVVVNDLEERAMIEAVYTKGIKFNAPVSIRLKDKS